MRTPRLALVAVALVVVGCSGGTASSPDPGRGARPPDPQHHVPSLEPWAPLPAETPYGGVTYDDPGINPFVDPDEDRVSTFALDVDSASYGIAQRYVADGYRPDRDSVRVEEWVNAFDHDYPPPRDATFAVAIDGGPTPFSEPDELVLRIGLQARDVRDRARDAAALTFVIDTSGSMEREARLETVKDALHELVDGLGRDDTVAIVTFGDDARVLLPPTSARDGGAIGRAIDDLRPGGSTNLEAGLRLGYGLARETLTENGIDRIVLASDGVANVGLTDPEGILAGIRADAAAGIELVAVGVGMGNYNDALLEQLADDGDGFYAYVDDRDEASRLFREDLTGTLQSVALDARVQVVFDPDAVAAYRQLGYENRAIDDRDFTDDTVQAGAIGAGHEVTALYAIRLRDDVHEGDRLASVALRWTDADRGSSESLDRDVHVADLAASFRATDPTFRLDALVAATAEVLRDSPWLPGVDLHEIARVAAEVEGGLPATDQAHGFLDLLDELARMEE
jgi:Ca-activated chloride channel family protein